MRFHKIDEMKFYCAILVVVLHVTASLEENSLSTFYNHGFYVPLMHIAVPFFFSATGVILGIKANQTSEDFSKYLSKYSLRILSLYITFSILYVCFRYLVIFADRLVLNTPFWSSSDAFIGTFHLKTILNGSIGSYQLWYLTSLFLAVLIIMLFNRLRLSASIILLISILQYIAYATGIITLNYVFNHGGVFKALLYVSLGFYIGSKQNIYVKRPLIWFIISLVLYAFLRNTGVAEIPMFFAILCLTTYCMEKKVTKPTKISLLGSYSLSIYILHVLFIIIIKKILIYSGIDNYYEYWIYYPVTIILCVTLPILTYSIIEKYFYFPIEKRIFKFFN